ncbi:MAG: tetratricopeptide repeat protein [Candidatus Atribacteria bacterium]|nr:MAG: tetratricopeptide repeat protein [Candidatus Atribacteria bacterium]
MVLSDAAKDKQLWAESYNEKINNPEDIVRLQSKIAETISVEIEARITPEEKLRIEKSPTASITAYEIYQKGNEEHWKFVNDNNLDALLRAENLFNAALEFDSTFAMAYNGLAKVYLEGNFNSSFLNENYLDTVLMFAELALSYDNQLAEAYTIKGICYTGKGNPEQALKEFDKALAYNPNFWKAYRGKGQLYQYGDQLSAIKNFDKAVSLYHGRERAKLLNDIGISYYAAGLMEYGHMYFQEKLELDHDSAEYFNVLAVAENWLGNFRKSLDYGKKAYSYDSSSLVISDRLAYNYMFLGEYEKSLRYYEKMVNHMLSNEIPDNVNTHRYAYIYWKTGNREKGAYLFNLEIEYCLRMNELGRKWEDQRYTFYDLAAVYAFLGEKDKAYENLRAFNQRQYMDVWMVTLIKDDPLFESIRNEPEYQQIVREVEGKYQAQRKRVQQWLEENDML